MKKKIIAVIAVASMTAACLAGCGKNETSVGTKDDVSEITEETPAVSEDEYTEVPDENGEDTIDKVFLLSVDEEKELFSSNSDRRAYFEGSKYEWWIRTPGHNQCTAVFVNADGDDVVSGAGVGEAEIGVRPAIWIDISK